MTVNTKIAFEDINAIFCQSESDIVAVEDLGGTTHHRTVVDATSETARRLSFTAATASRDAKRKKQKSCHETNTFANTFGHRVDEDMTINTKIAFEDLNGVFGAFSIDPLHALEHPLEENPCHSSDMTSSTRHSLHDRQSPPPLHPPPLGRTPTVGRQLIFTPDTARPSHLISPSPLKAQRVQPESAAFSVFEDDGEGSAGISSSRTSSAFDQVKDSIEKAKEARRLSFR